MTFKSQYFSISASIFKIKWKFNTNTFLNANSSIDSLAVISEILSKATHRLHEQSWACVVYHWSMSIASDFFKFISVRLYDHSFTLYQISLSHFFVFFFFRVACGMKNLISQSSVIVIIIFFIDALIFVEKGFRLYKCIIILSTFICNRSSCFSAVSFAI